MPPGVGADMVEPLKTPAGVCAAWSGNAPGVGTALYPGVGAAAGVGAL
jgi:hypothetical protein